VEGLTIHFTMKKVRHLNVAHFASFVD